MGDSLSAAYGIELEQGWVNLLQNKLNHARTENKSWHIINASVSGDTTAGAVARLPDLFILYCSCYCLCCDFQYYLIG